MFDTTTDVSVTERIHAIRIALAAVCGDLEPDRLTGAEAAAAHEALTAITKLSDGAQVRLARRIDEAKVWQESGDASAADFLARMGGTTKHQAREALDTSWRLRDLAATEEAVRRGQLSATQASAVADGARVDPDAEQRLLRTAAHQPVTELRDEVRRTKAAADPDPQATHRRIHHDRRLGRWTDAEGAYNLALRTTAEQGARIDAALQPAVDVLFTCARRAGRREPVEAYAVDALVDLVTAVAPVPHTPRSARREAKVIVHVDAQALTRGDTRPGERCEIAGVGPVAVATVRALLPEAFVAVVFEDAVDVRSVAHAGRQVTAHQRTALEARGYRCEVPACPSRHRLEIDHIKGWAVTRLTRLDDLAWLCPIHHRAKTHGGWRLSGPPGRRRWAHHPQSDTAPDPPASDRLSLVSAEPSA